MLLRDSCFAHLPPDTSDSLHWISSSIMSMSDLHLASGKLPPSSSHLNGHFIHNFKLFVYFQVTIVTTAVIQRRAADTRQCLPRLLIIPSIHFRRSMTPSVERTAWSNGPCLLRSSIRLPCCPAGSRCRCKSSINSTVINCLWWM